MTTPKTGDLRKGAESALFWVRGLLFIGGLLVAAWAQFLGPGIRTGLQHFLGIAELKNRMTAVERHMPAPPVVEWDLAFMKQLGSCTPVSCNYLMVGARTAYGEDCGQPTAAKPFIRVLQQPAQEIRFRDFQMVELTRVSKSFVLPLAIPPSLERGLHSFRVEITYPHCEGPNEPIIRKTPWLPLEVKASE